MGALPSCEEFDQDYPSYLSVVLPLIRVTHVIPKSRFAQKKAPPAQPITQTEPQSIWRLTASQHLQIRNCGNIHPRISRSLSDSSSISSTSTFLSNCNDDFESILSASSKRSSKNLSQFGTPELGKGTEMSPLHWNWKKVDGMRGSGNFLRSSSKSRKHSNQDEDSACREAALDQLQAVFNDLLKKISDSMALLRHTSAEVHDVTLVVQAQHSHSKDILDTLSNLQNLVLEDTRMCERIYKLHDTLLIGIAAIDDGGHYLDKTMSNLYKEKEITGFRYHSAPKSDKVMLKKHIKELEHMISTLKTKKWIVEEFIDEVSKEVENYQEKVCTEYTQIHETAEIIGQFTQEEECIVGELYKHLLHLEDTQEKLKNKCSQIEEIKSMALKRWKELEDVVMNEEHPVSFYVEEFGPSVVTETHKFWLEMNQPVALTDYITHIAAKLEKFSQQAIAVKETQRRQVYILKKTQQEVWNRGSTVRELASKTLQLQTQIKQMQEELKRDSTGTSFEEPLSFSTVSANGSMSEDDMSSARVSTAGGSMDCDEGWTVIEKDRAPTRTVGSAESFVQVVTPRSLPSTPGMWWEPNN